MNKEKECRQHPKGEGFVHLYYGNGKGKTTAAMGLALRAADADCGCISPSLSRA